MGQDDRSPIPGDSGGFIANESAVVTAGVGVILRRLPESNLGGFDDACDFRRQLATLLGPTVAIAQVLRVEVSTFKALLQCVARHEYGVLVGLLEHANLVLHRVA